MTRHADRVAVSTEWYQWTYRQLDAISDSVASQIAESGVDRTRPVALLMNHDAAHRGDSGRAQNRAALFGSSNHADPIERKAAVWERSDAVQLLVDENLAAEGGSISGDHIVVRCGPQIDSSFSGETDSLNPDALASLTFTSGTTGQPKGVCQSHRGLLHHCLNYTAIASLAAADRISLATPCHLGASLSSLWGALMNGAFRIDLRTQGIHALPRWIERNAITVLHLVPSAFGAMASMVLESKSESALRSLRLVRLGGEAVRSSDFELFKKCTPAACKLLVAYSSTETGAACMMTLDHDSRVDAERIPVGSPMPGMQVDLLDDSRARFRDAVGRIVIRSRFLSRGYWCDPRTDAHVIHDRYRRS